ncbi:TPA: hypothetical protein ACX6S7_000943 [Photobacterium damselae]
MFLLHLDIVDMKFKKFIENYFPDINLVDFNSIDLSNQWIHQDKKNFNEVLSWPPNVFIILYSLLEYTDKYRLLVSPQEHFIWEQEHKHSVEQLSADWLALISNQLSEDKKRLSFISLLYNLGNVFNQTNFSKGIYDLMNEKDFSLSVFLLVISIDELFSNVNICNYKFENKLEVSLLIRDLTSNPKLRNNLADVECKLGYVTFKTKVPQSGLTINNLTRNLTCVKPSVSPTIIKNKREKKHFNNKTYNILFLPWPLVVNDLAFRPVETPIDKVMDDYFGFFEYSPSEKLSSSDFVVAIISAIKNAGSIDLIVLPECALDEVTYGRFKDLLFDLFGEDAPSLLSGVYGHDENSGKNIAKLSFIGESGSFDTVEQNKHHRWFLDNSQLRNYNLSNALDPSRKWWENIPVGRRNLVSLHTPNGVRLCPLICEDLARQEPVAQAVRAVGPNLVVSLLLDGPQLKDRWPGKYSAVLSDDPGASVLSVTALGMTLRSTGLGYAPSRVVGLWSEPGGISETLEMKDEGLGIIIGLELVDEKMWTIDGRSSDTPVLRKKFHTTLMSDYADVNNSKLPYYKRQLQDILKRR